ncbi:CIDE_N [Spodoptera frugiperda granulovirus]|uniref:CIDE N n=1 Tax=Spodoptera frugiperda granulovirus TaxID=307454 RepID=A0A0C5AUT8_9BBAC|nr:CIDE_N [Spodoptera frugiperda granulovirus]AJK91693.1 CIDE_N [Spodoptera frugiperda granulovirus]AXS01051.1 CIDE N [Spodoptera frugiperda granulovirus]
MAKPFKVYNVEKQTGVMAATLTELCYGIKKLFNVTEDVIPCLSDGTRIETEEYFQSLSPNELITYFVVYEDWDWCGIEALIEQLRTDYNLY